MPGLRVGRLSSGNDLSTRMSLNVTPSLSKICNILRCTLSKFSCG